MVAMEKSPKLIFFIITEDGTIINTNNGKKILLFDPFIVKPIETLPKTIKITASICLADLDYTRSNIIAFEIYDPDGKHVQTIRGILNEKDDEIKENRSVAGIDIYLDIHKHGEYKVDAVINDTNRIATTYFVVSGTVKEDGE